MISLHEKERWAKSVAAWELWAEPMAAMADRLNQPLLTAIDVQPGHFVLDLGAGVGEPALSAARRVASNGRVIGIDLEPDMLRVAQRRTESAQLSASFVAADMTRLPFADAVFDRAICRFGVMFVPETRTALAETHRVLRTEGKAAFMVWGARADNDLFDVIGRVVSETLGEDAPNDHGRYPLEPLFRFAAPGSLSAAMAEAGFVDAQETALRPVRKVRIEEPFWQAALDMVFGPRLALCSETERARILCAIPAAFAKRAEAGALSLAMHARIVSGRKAADATDAM